MASTSREADLVRELRALVEADPRLTPLVQVVIDRLLPVAAQVVRYIGISEVERRVGLERSTIWRWCRARRFPLPTYNGTRRIWSLTEIEQWEAKRASAPHARRLRGIAARRAKGAGHALP